MFLWVKWKIIIKVKYLSASLFNYVFKGFIKCIRNENSILSRGYSKIYWALRFGLKQTYNPKQKKVNCTPTFFFLHPHNIMQRPNSSYYFLKTLKCTWTVFMFLHSGLWNLENFSIGTFGEISDPPIRNSKYVFHIKKIHHSKKAFQIHRSVTEICILDSEIHNLKKKILDPPMIRLLDSEIWKSIIYEKLLPEHPLIQKKKDSVSDFWIHSIFPDPDFQ